VTLLLLAIVIVTVGWTLGLLVCFGVGE